MSKTCRRGTSFFFGSGITYTWGIFIVLLLVGISCPQKLHRNKREKSAKRWCTEDRKICKKNSTCNYAYNYVRDICWTKDDSRCGAPSEKLMTCLHYIEILRSTAFTSEPSQCSCFMSGNVKIKKLERCSKIHNLVFANPCYDNAVAARDESIKIASMTVRNYVAKEVDDVTENNYVTQSVPQENAVLLRNNIQNSKPTPAPTSTPSHDVQLDKHRDLVVRKPPSEHDYMELDSMFAQVNEKQPLKERSLLEVIGESTDEEVSSTVRSDEVGKATPPTQTTEGERLTTEQPPTQHTVLQKVMEPEAKPSSNDQPTLMIVLAVIGGSMLIIISVVGGYVYSHRQRQRTCRRTSKEYKAGKIVKKPSLIIRSLHDNKYNCRKTKLHV